MTGRDDARKRSGPKGSGAERKDPLPEKVQPEGEKVPLEQGDGAGVGPEQGAAEQAESGKPGLENLGLGEQGEKVTGVGALPVLPAKAPRKSVALPRSLPPKPEGAASDGQESEVRGLEPQLQAVPADPQPLVSPQSHEGLDDLADLTPELVPMFPGAASFLARFLPYSPPTHAGLNQNFCDLHAFLKYLHEAAWYGYLHASLGDQTAYVLLFEGRTVTAAAASATGEQALGELLSLYEQGAALSAHPLPAVLAHVLSGVGNRAWKFNLTEDFTGLHARPTGAIFYARGEIVATLPATLPYEGAFPAPLRPQTLILPRSLAGWAHHQYPLTLRGRDAMNAITGVYQQFRMQHGLAGIAFLRALGESLTPAEYAMRSDVALHDLEPLVQEFIKTGCVREN